MFFTLISETPEAFAKSVCFHPSKARAARICGGSITTVCSMQTSMAVQKITDTVICVVDGHQSIFYGHLCKPMGSLMEMAMESSEQPAPSSGGLDVLKAMRELLARDGGWTQRACARDADGREVDELSDRAVAFDLLGALTRAGRDAPRAAVHDAIARLRAGIGFETLGAWNDAPGRTQAEAVGLADAAIAAAEAPTS